MLRYVSRRLVETFLALLGTSVFVFSMIHMIPGDPALMVAGLEAGPEVVEQIRRELGLDRPLYVQYASFLANALKGDLGVSIRTGYPVAEEILDRFPYTLGIAVGGTVLATVGGMLTGIVAAMKHNRFWDGAVMVLSLLAVSTPSYWLGLMLMLLFSLSLGWFPSIGIRTPAHYVLPIVTLGAQSGGTISRMTRSAMLDVLGQEYVRAARARGSRENSVIVRHALKNALIPVISIVGLRFGQLLAGTVLVESVFAIPGVGRLLVDAVLWRDYPMVQGTMLFVASVFVVVNSLTDVLYAVVDPRIRVTSP
ncbi:MAG TPA: ABC transporter permease [Vicinamibacteria bacterium]|nr:ABC transporter permease [Vicinamibacteria bacterium]